MNGIIVGAGKKGMEKNMLTDMQKREFTKDFVSALETVSKREKETGIDATTAVWVELSEYHRVEFHFEAVLVASFKAN